MTVSRETLIKLRARIEGKFHQKDAPLFLLVGRLARINRMIRNAEESTPPQI
jgi:hypothetical protein